MISVAEKNCVKILIPIFTSLKSSINPTIIKGDKEAIKIKNGFSLNSGFPSYQGMNDS